MRFSHRKNFTLIEIMAVITIFMVVSAVAASRLRSDRTPQRIQETLREFRRYSARLRNFAMTNDCIVRVMYDPETQEVFAEKLTENAYAVVEGDDAESSDLPYPVILDIKEYEEAPLIDEKAPAELSEKERRFRFPVKLKPEFKVVGLEELNLGESLELWRFNQSGEAVQHSPLVITFAEETVRSISVSLFSGELVVKKGDVTEDGNEA